MDFFRTTPENIERRPCSRANCHPLTRLAVAHLRRSMTKGIFIISFVAVSLAAACATARFPQTKSLAGGQIRVESAWIYDTARESARHDSPPLLRIKFRYIGVKPDEYRYSPRAALRTTPEDKDIESQYVWLVGLPKTEQPRDGTPLVWEFRDFPRDSERMYLAIYFMDRSTHEVKEQFVFALPGARQLPHRGGTVP